MSGRTIIGHGMTHYIGAIHKDLWEGVEIFDTQSLYGRTALKKLAPVVGMNVQKDFHDPSDDAKATMLLYLRRKPYQKRNSFDDAPFELIDDEFPALGTATKKDKTK